MEDSPPAGWFARKWRWLLPVVGVAIAIVAWLAFAVFGIHTLFIDDKVSEAGPEFESGASATDAVVQEDAIDVADDSDTTDLVRPTAPPTSSEPVLPSDTTPDVVTLFGGSFVDRSHPARGTAVVLGDGTDQRFLRFEDFATDNGPDLNVYLSTASADSPADEFDDDFVDLGNLRGNIGTQNYEIPAGVSIERYGTVVIWCVRFEVAFGAADLGSPSE
jgi:hypothetical protein